MIQGLTARKLKCLPSQRKGPGVVQVLISRSWHSSKRSRFSTGFMLVDTVSTPVPRTIPEMTRPPEMTSIIAISSARRTGFS